MLSSKMDQYLNRQFSNSPAPIGGIGGSISNNNHSLVDYGSKVVLRLVLRFEGLTQKKDASPLWAFVVEKRL